MPKIIENIRESLLEKARHQVMEQGYSTMTIRSVAKACKVGVGTVYNYFPSKDMLVASFMLEDWLQCVAAFTKACKEAETKYMSEDSIQALSEEIIKDAAVEALRSIYWELSHFLDKYRVLFSDEDASVGYASAFSSRHKQLRDQIAAPLFSICNKQSKTNPDFLAEFMAESMLTWTMEGYEFEQITEVLLQLL